MIAAGYARRIAVTERTMEKLGLKTRADLVGYAVQRGWLAGA